MSGFRLVSRASDAAHACVVAWREGGIDNLLRLVSGAVYWRFHPVVRRWASELPRQQAIDEAFDKEFGVDTAGEISLSDVGIAAADVERGHGRYRPVWARVLHAALGALRIEFEPFVFIDYGSGKGKALLLASDYPFAEIRGIEFARPLHDLAQQNIAKYKNPAQRCHVLHSECIDALHFVPPERPLVCFFFNPFDDATTAAVLDTLHESVRRRARQVFIIYCNMRDVGEHAHTFRSKRYLKPIAKHRQYLSFEIA
jgi:hypothetical protein